MSNFDGELVGKFCVQRPLALRVLQRHGIDPTSPGSLAVCCHDRGIELDALLTELLATEAQVAGAWRTRAISELLDHVVRTFHRPFAAKLGELIALLDAARPTTEPALSAWTTLRDQLVELGTDVEQHMLKEEQVLFPWLRNRATTASVPIRAMQLEHRDTIALLLDVHAAATAWRTTSSDTHARAAATKLDEIEDWVCGHIHLEDNELFPRALEAI